MKTKMMLEKALAMMALFTGIAFSSCSDNDDFWVESELPQDTDLTMLEVWNYAVPFEVQSNGEWKIETTGDWFYVSPKSGTGNTIVEICVLENDTEDRRRGTIALLSAANSSKMQTFEIGQKSIADYDDNGILDKKPSIKKYAVGFGYNTLGEYASPTSVTNQIVDWYGMDKVDKIQINAPDAEFYERTVTGSSLEDLAQNLSASVSFGGSYCGFKGEIGASFKGGTAKNEYNEYAISYIEYKVTDISIPNDPAEIKKHWLLDAAKRAIDGVDDNYKGAEGVKNLLKQYGTHLITKAEIGGRLKYNLTVDVSKISGFYDIAAYAKASYSNAFINLDASVDADMKKAYENNSKNIDLSFKAVGGVSVNLTSTSNEKAIDEWKQSVYEGYEDVDKNKTALIGFGSDMEGLLPIYELASNPQRAAEIKAVMEGRDFVTVEYEDKSVYDIQTPEFSNKKEATLVKDVMDDNNRVVAKVCSEFIPEINTTKRVNVVYPVVSGKILMNAGFFIGYKGRCPARVSWNGSDLKIVDLEELGEKEYRKLYLKGATINTRLFTEKAPKKTKTVDDYLVADRRHESGHKYPLVKIFGNVWTREDYRSLVKGDGYPIQSFGKVIDTGSGRFIAGRENNALLSGYWACFYRLSFVGKEGFSPAGWEVPSASHYKAIHAMLTKYNLRTEQLFRNKDGNSPLGYETPLVGDGWVAISGAAWDNLDYVVYAEASKQNEYVTKDGNHVRINDSGFVVEPIADNYYMPVRLIKNN